MRLWVCQKEFFVFRVDCFFIKVFGIVFIVEYITLNIIGI